jgi:beta-glucosidase
MTTAAPGFPKEFFWGCASSAYQVEGAVAEDGRGPSIWDTFTHTPGKVLANENGDVAADHYHRWAEDLDQLKSLGANAYRFSIAWPRVLPQGGQAINPAGLAFYDRLVDGLLDRGITPFATLFHWDLPQAVEDRGGWPARATADEFEEYARVVARRLGDRVTWWMTHNEPFFSGVGGYFLGNFAPGVVDPVAAMRASHHLLLSHGQAARAIREEARRPVKVGIALSLSAVHPATESEADRQAAERFDAFTNRWFLDPLMRGAYPAELASRFAPLGTPIEPGDMETIRQPLDFVGVNYYSRSVIRHDETVPFLEAAQVKPDQGEFSMMWEIYPSGLLELLKRLWADYHPPLLIVTENGMPLADAPDGHGRVVDEARISYLARHVTQVQRAMQQGVSVGGYFVWSLTDNFEWALGYGMRFGLVYVDFATQRRIPKASAAWFRRLVAQGLTEVAR